MSANDYQIAGSHYRKGEGEQHWDRVHRLGLNYFQAMITRYVERYRDKGGVEDLRKAKHFLEKLIELEESKTPAAFGKPDWGTWHWQSKSLGMARCGADYAGMQLTDDVDNVTCEACIVEGSKYEPR